MPAMIDIDRIFHENRDSPPSERTLPWEETRDGICGRGAETALGG